jgi:hypothetical protein
LVKSSSHSFPFHVHIKQVCTECLLCALLDCIG